MGTMELILRVNARFINQAQESIVDYGIESKGLIRGLAEFMIGNESISSHMPLLTVIGITLLGNMNMEPTVFDLPHIMNNNTTEYFIYSSISIFRWNIFSWTQYIELISVSGDRD
jgi:hypothetical protein